MGLIFERPPVETREVTVGDQTLVLYQFTADVFWDHLSTVEGMMAVTPQEAGEEAAGATGESDEALTADQDRRRAEQLLEACRTRKEWNLLSIACALAPGYPGAKVPELREELGRNLSPAQVTELVNELNELNGITFPKADARTGAS